MQGEQAVAHAQVTSKAQIALETFKTNFDPAQLTAELAKRILRLLKAHKALSNCEGIGLVVPGMVDHHSGRVLNAPTLGWRDVDVLPMVSILLRWGHNDQDTNI